MSEMIERVAIVLEQSFKDRVAASAGQPFDATGVTVPGPEVWVAYAEAAVKAVHECMLRERNGEIAVGVMQRIGFGLAHIAEEGAVNTNPRAGGTPREGEVG